MNISCLILNPPSPKLQTIRKQFCLNDGGQREHHDQMQRQVLLEADKSHLTVQDSEPNPKSVAAVSVRPGSPSGK